MIPKFAGGCRSAGTSKHPGVPDLGTRCLPAGPILFNHPVHIVADVRTARSQGQAIQQVPRARPVRLWAATWSLARDSLSGANLELFHLAHGFLEHHQVGIQHLSKLACERVPMLHSHGVHCGK